MPIEFQSYQPAEKRALCPIVAIDMGFAREGESCGFATNFPSYLKVRPKTKKVSGVTGENLTFAQAVDAAAQVTGGTRDLILILEAPLSCHWENGNPCARHGLENGSPWYRSAGAVTALGAHCFLSQLAEKCANVKCRIHLIEGFVTGEDSRNHWEVATKLLVRLRSNAQAPQTWHGVSMPGTVLEMGSPAPPVITIRD